MKTLADELSQQPQALRDLADAYAANPGWLDDAARLTGTRILLTGMGASFHTAAIAALHLNHLGLASEAVEAADLLNYGLASVGSGTLVIYISQSGESGEVAPLLERLGQGTPVLAITNEPGSTLARGVRAVLPLIAGEEDYIASKTYLNTLAVLWLMARRLAGRQDGTEFDFLRGLAGRAETLLFGAGVGLDELVDTVITPGQPLILLGHGPHAVTARHAAMILSEWTKASYLHSSIAGFRHGFIESIQSGSAVVIVAPPGSPTTPSALKLAEEIEGYGGRVALVENGLVRLRSHPASSLANLDEWLSPALDIIPIERLADHLAQRRGFGRGFRYIQKVVKMV